MFVLFLVDTRNGLDIKSGSASVDLIFGARKLRTK